MWMSTLLYSYAPLNLVGRRFWCTMMTTTRYRLLFVWQFKMIQSRTPPTEPHPCHTALDVLIILWAVHVLIASYLSSGDSHSIFVFVAIPLTLHSFTLAILFSIASLCGCLIICMHFCFILSSYLEYIRNIEDENIGRNSYIIVNIKELLMACRWSTGLDAYVNVYVLIIRIGFRAAASHLLECIKKANNITWMHICKFSKRKTDWISIYQKGIIGIILSHQK